jgi:hypothetical protein
MPVYPMNQATLLRAEAQQLCTVRVILSLTRSDVPKDRRRQVVEIIVVVPEPIWS